MVRNKWLAAVILIIGLLLIVWAGVQIFLIVCMGYIFAHDYDVPWSWHDTKIVAFLAAFLLAGVAADFVAIRSLLLRNRSKNIT
jgi:hypothetical protein